LVVRCSGRRMVHHRKNEKGMIVSGMPSLMVDTVLSPHASLAAIFLSIFVIAAGLCCSFSLFSFFVSPKTASEV
jgi:hypothetical protein